MTFPGVPISRKIERLRRFESPYHRRRRAILLQCVSIRLVHPCSSIQRQLTSVPSTPTWIKKGHSGIIWGEMDEVKFEKSK